MRTKLALDLLQEQAGVKTVSWFPALGLIWTLFLLWGNTDILSLWAEDKGAQERWFCPSPQAVIRWAATDHKCALSISTVAQNQCPWVPKPIFAQQSLAVSGLEQPPWSVQEELWAGKVSQTLHIRHLDSWRNAPELSDFPDFKQGEFWASLNPVSCLHGDEQSHC